MALEPGTRLGPYEVVAPLGAGGMGEVYRARDGRLKRDVALKILPSSVAGDPERLARFEREAQALAALNHPNIAAIYGFEESAGATGAGERAIVLELVEGDTIAERIALGRIPSAEALAIARQIAAALEAAHEQGIVHRDLKPANIKITPDGVVKVLDFGLAKLSGSADGSDSSLGRTMAASMSPTMTSPALATGAGILLGTAAYMSPEQARGKTADKRADIWAFGVVLYEMLTGTRAFGGDSVTETAGAVIHKELDLAALPADLPAAARTVLRRCLQKDPTQRVRDIGDVRLALDGAFTSDMIDAAPARAGTSRRMIELAAVGLLAAIAAGAAVWWFTRTEPPVRYPIRLDVAAPERMGPFVVMSPDGRNIAFVAGDENNTARLWVHSLESGESRQITNAGVVFGAPPFWSPDSRRIAFAADGKLKRIDIAGGPAEVLCDVANLLGGTWTSGNVILFTDFAKKGILQVPASGGTPVQRTLIDEKRGEGGDFLPWALPDGRHFLYLKGGNQNVVGIYIGSTDLEPAAQDRTRLMSAEQQVAYVPPGNGGTKGHLLFLREGLLTAQPFDTERLQLRGEPTTIVEPVARTQIFGSFGVSATGTLAYVRADSDTGSVVIVGRDGKPTTTIAPNLRSADNPRLSPDGRSLAVVVSGDVWRYDLDGRPPIKLTFNGRHFSPLWSRDGQRVVTEHSGENQLSAVPADGSGGTPQQASPKGHFHPHAWTANGSEIIAARLEMGGAIVDLVRFPPRADGQVQTIVATPAGEGFGGSLSPDGRWVAYTSESTGRNEIWVRPFPGPGPAVRVSSNGGVEPVWARNGKELYYIEGGSMMTVAVETAASFNFKPAARLFESTYSRSQQPPSYDVTLDGGFVMIKPDDAGERPISVILNWQERLSARNAH